jgi:hypothetical protein
MDHRPLGISNFIEPSSRILNGGDWQDSSFETLARLMISKNFKWLLAEGTQNIFSLTHKPFAPFLHAGLARSSR